jgi:cytochrome c peroxidase
MKQKMIAATTLALALGASSAYAEEAVNPRLLRRFKPIRVEIDSDQNPVTGEKINLGRMLYFDARLSQNRDLSCNSCHPLDKYGADGEVTSKGTKGQRGKRNSPTVYHAAANFVQFWDGRARDVEEQAGGPIVNPAEMAMSSPAEAVARIRSIPGYAPIFKKAFPDAADPISYENIGKAIGAFERRLVTPARWDRFLEGDKTALSAQEIEGLRVFSNSGCMVCHTGELLGGSMYQRVGVVEPWPNQSDRGRAEATKSSADEMYFKVPTLRNVAMTGPYFHDGSAPTLKDAVEKMAKHQLGVTLEDNEVAAIVAWLGSLTGALPLDYIKPPVLPKDSTVTASVK